MNARDLNITTTHTTSLQWDWKVGAFEWLKLVIHSDSTKLLSRTHLWHIISGQMSSNRVLQYLMYNTEDPRREKVEVVFFWSWEKQFQGTLHIYGRWNHKRICTERFSMGEDDPQWSLLKLKCITEFIHSINVKRLRPQISRGQGGSRDTS